MGQSDLLKFVGLKRLDELDKERVEVLRWEWATKSKQVGERNWFGPHMSSDVKVLSM